MRISDWISDVCSSDLLITGRRTSTGYCGRTNSMFLFGKGVTDGVASELLGTISRILDESGKPLSARAIVKALEQSGELVPSGETPWKTVGARLSVDIRSNRESEFMRVGRGLYALTAWKRSEEHTSELQSLMRISYAVLCL